MLGIGFFEILVIALVCFIAIGPKQLPFVMRKLAVLYRQFLSLREEFKFQILSADSEFDMSPQKKLPSVAPGVDKPVEIEKEANHG